MHMPLPLISSNDVFFVIYVVYKLFFRYLRSVKYINRGRDFNPCFGDFFQYPI